MMTFNVLDVGIDARHETGFTIDRPQGTPFHLLLHFQSRAEVVTADGVTATRPGDCLIYAPGTPQRYRGRTQVLRYDWLHCDSADLPGLLARYHLPVDRLFHPRDTSAVTSLADEIRRERLLRPIFWEDAVERLCSALFLHLARQNAPRLHCTLCPSLVRYLDRLNAIRLQVHERIDHAWTVAEMARLGRLGANRFAVLYRKFYDISPMEDLIRARIARAQWLLLSNRSVPVAEVAEQCGFGSLYHFNRLFRQRVGTPPGRFRTGEDRTPEPALRSLA